MEQLTRRRQTLQPHLGWHGARLLFVSMFLMARLRVKTVNMAQLATGFMGSAQIESDYKRLQRFFRFFAVDYRAIAHTVLDWMQIPQPGV